MINEDLLDLIKDHPRICIQMHDNPDADAITSAYSLQNLLSHFNRRSDILYYGKPIQKPSLIMLINEYKIDCRNVKEDEIEDLDYTLNIHVDCQPGEGNVHNLKIRTIGVIDHHIQTKEFDKEVEYTLIDDNLASCGTLIWILYGKYNVPIDKRIGACLYYGLMKDTNDFTNVLAPQDRDMRDYLEESNLIEFHLINLLMKENLKYTDLMISQRALSSYMRDTRYKSLAVVQAETCEQNLLGSISDILISTEEVTLAVVFTEEDDFKYRLSVRSCDKFIKADDVIKHLTDGIGSGGGNLDKSGGVIFKDKFHAKYKNHTIQSYIESGLVEVYNKYGKIEVGVDILDTALLGEINEYEKIPKTLRYLILEDLFETQDEILLRTLEGDVIVDVKDNVVIIGIAGEVYPISKDMFNNSYTLNNKQDADCDHGVKNNKYKPKLKSMLTGKEVFINNVKEHQTCETKPVKIKAVKLNSPYKALTKWDKVSPHLGNVGDYLVVKTKDDYYIINEDIFHETYKLIK